jgi:hypothetical protein
MPYSRPIINRTNQTSEPSTIQRKMAMITTNAATIPVVWMVLAGQEGLEPPTFGFGDRRSAN